MAEELVIAHLAREERIGPCTKGIAQHEGSGTATEGHALNGSSQQLVGTQRLYTELTLHQRHKLLGRQRHGQHAYYTTPLSVDHRTLQRLQVLEAKLLGHLEIDPAFGIVQIRMGSHDDDIVLDGLHHGSLHVVAIADMSQFPEDKRMVSHNEVAAPPNGFVDDFLRHVKTQ